ncbi:hypothetical protein [Actinomadura yumaensis]|uniref:Uncharacterized protein n=1 Tax=Actinomadura yumaensis TaxID=111807 RepID=A0ABW2CR27_9ACTN
MTGSKTAATFAVVGYNADGNTQSTTLVDGGLAAAFDVMAAMKADHATVDVFTACHSPKSTFPTLVLPHLLHGLVEHARPIANAREALDLNEAALVETYTRPTA